MITIHSSLFFITVLIRYLQMALIITFWVLREGVLIYLSYYSE